MKTYEDILNELRTEHARDGQEIDRLRIALRNARQVVQSLAMRVDRSHMSWKELNDLTHSLSKAIDKN